MYLFILLLIVVMYLMNIIELFLLKRSYILLYRNVIFIFWIINILRLIFIFFLFKDFNIYDLVLIKLFLIF